MSSPEEWFKALPPVTKTWLCSAVLTTALVSFGLVDPMQLFLYFPFVYGRFQIWRLVTTFLFFGKFSFSFIFSMFILSRYTQMLETTQFEAEGGRGTAELVFLLLFNAIWLIILDFLLGGNIPFLASALSFSLLYVWSRKSPYRQVSFWGFGFKAWHLPFVLLGFGLLLGANPILDILGILVGHLYHFLMDILPNSEYKISILYCPQWLYKIFDETEARRDNWRGTTGHRIG